MSTKALCLSAATVAIAMTASVAFADHFSINNYPTGWTSSTTSSTQVFQGYSSQPQHSPNGQGTSSITSSTTTYIPPGQGGANNPHVFSTDPVISTTGPGNSPSGKILGR